MKTTVSPKELALAVGISESTIKRWVDDGAIQATRTRGRHRRIALADAVQFIRQSGTPIVHPEFLGLADLVATRPDEPARRPLEEALQDALVNGRASEARGTVLSLYLEGRSPAQVWDTAISKAMTYVGTLWQHATSGIYVEHRATDICMQALYVLRNILPPPKADSPAAVGAGPSGDPYALPSLMAATSAAAAGFRDINLGPETPVDVLAQAAVEFRARLVWLAVSVDRPLETLDEETDRLSEALVACGAQLVVGGRAIPKGFVLRRANSRVARTMSELEAFAQGLVAS